jgi:hypothetical protein
MSQLYRLLRDWVIANYPVAEKDAMPSATRMLDVWPILFYELQDDPGFDELTRILMLTSIPAQVREIYQKHDTYANHTIKEMTGLANASVAWPEFREAREWYDYARNVLSQALVDQVYPDGVHKELSSHYHKTVLGYFMQFRAISERIGANLPQTFAERLEAMGNYMAYAIKPSGFAVNNNDSNLEYNRDIVRQLAGEFDRPDWM